jgi:hypothetical protein
MGFASLSTHPTKGRVAAFSRRIAPVIVIVLMLIGRSHAGAALSLGRDACINRSAVVSGATD